MRVPFSFLQILLYFVVFTNLTIATSQSNPEPLFLWDDQPAPNRGGDPTVVKAGGYPYDQDWELHSYPLGNGYMGANFFGRTDVERIQITEKTLCNKGLYALGGITNFAEIFLTFGHNQISNYKRSIDLNTGIAHINYVHDSTEYEREYLTSYPDNVMAIKLKSSKPGSLNFKLAPTIPYVRDSIQRYFKTSNAKVNDNKIILYGLDNYLSINYELQVAIKNFGGNLTIETEKKDPAFVIKEADSALVYIVTGTNYELSQELFLQRRNDKKLDLQKNPREQLNKRMAQVEELGYASIRQRHLDDYQQLFSRVALNLSDEFQDIPTRTLIEQYKNETKNTYLEKLLYQYGRYLLISSSRKGTLPSGLQGVWSQYEITPWTGGYWHNINIQMNYWGAFNGNLAETFLPYIEYHRAYLPMAQKHADRYIQRFHPDKFSDETGENGWTIGTAANPYKVRAAGGHSGPGTGGMTSKMLWDYFAFTQDTLYLKSTGYPALLGMSKFLSKTLKANENGHYLVQNSASPEQMHNGKYVMTTGSTFDQGFVWENHNDVLKAANVLGIKTAFLDQVKEEMKQLDPVLIGASGQIKEFREEEFYGDIGEKEHRHVSHLCGLYPGELINSSTPEWLEAAKISLDLRGNRTTGWAMAHRLNLRARSLDGNAAYELVQKMLRERTLPNLWTTHPPFQIDGNFGYLAGVNEMLLQSHEGFIRPLAALPDEWNSGSYNGLVARGNFVVDCVWKEGVIKKLQILSRSGGSCKIKVPPNSQVTLTDQNNRKVQSKFVSSDLIQYTTQKGERYQVIVD